MTTNIDFSDCKKCPIRKECKQCEIKDLTCQELYNLLNEEQEVKEICSRIKYKTAR